MSSQPGVPQRGPSHAAFVMGSGQCDACCHHLPAGSHLRRGEGRWSGQAGMGRRREGRLAPSREGTGQEKWSTAGKERNGPTDEVGALERTEICQDLGRGETGTVEGSGLGKGTCIRRNPGRRNWDGWDGREGKVDMVEVGRLGRRKKPHLLQKSAVAG